MPSHTGIFPTFLDTGGKTVVEDTTISNIPEFGAPFETDEQAGARILPNNQHNIIFPGDDPKNAVLETVWLIPIFIDAGFITEDLFYKITVWNAYTEAFKQIDSITPTNPTGTQLDYPALPQVLAPSSESEHDLTIFHSGPPTQATNYLYSISSVDYDLEIIGQRIISFPYEPQWSQGVQVRYKFQTVINRTKRYSEQRRPLRNVLRREQVAEFAHWQYRQRRILNELKPFMFKTLAIPVYSEPITPTEDLQGELVVSVDNNLDNLYNFQNLDFVLIKKISDITETEIKQIQSRATNEITFTQTVVKDFKQNDTVIYPVFLGIISRKSFQLTTDGIVITSLEFRETV